MKNIVKKFDRVGLMVLLAALFVAVGFKAAEKMENAPIWYEVVIDGNDPEPTKNQKIGDPYPAGSSPSGDCNNLPGNICAIKLDVEPELAPSNVFEAAAMGVTTGESRNRQ